MKENWEPFAEAAWTNIDPAMDSLRKQSNDRAPFKIMLNNYYQVAVYEPAEIVKGWPLIVHLSIKRRDKSHVRDWRHMQRIKNELVGAENEGLEIYPAESRLVDTANQYHMFVFASPEAKIPMGFGERWVCDESSNGTYQRPFPDDAKPKDLKTLAQYCADKNLKLETK